MFGKLWSLIWSTRMSMLMAAIVGLVFCLIVFTTEQFTLNGRFRRLKKRWEKETEYTSSATEIINHPAYQAIIALGPDMIPLILKDLEFGFNHWGYALERITHAQPVPCEAYGDAEKVRAAWLAWGRQLGFIR